MTSTSLLGLPTELLLLLPGNLYSLEDLYTLMLTSKRLYHIYKNTSKHILRPAANSSPTLPGLQPSPHFLVSLAARRVADWAVQNDERKRKLHDSLGGGMQSLLSLAIEVVDDGITLDDIRQAWKYKQDVLYPLSYDMGLVCGPSPDDDDNDDENDDDDGTDICYDSDLALFNWIIFGDLFQHSISAFYDDPRPSITPLPSAIRFKFLIYCVPDTTAFSRTGGFPAWFEDYGRAGQQDTNQQWSLIVATYQFLDEGIWSEAMGRDGRRRSVDLVSSARELILISSVRHLGSKSLQVLRPGGFDAMKEEISMIEAKINKLPDSVVLDPLQSGWDDPWPVSPLINMIDEMMITFHGELPGKSTAKKHWNAFLAAVR